MDVTRVDRFVRYWQRIHARTRRVVECIPEADLEWSPVDGKWSPGDLTRHLAVIERYMFIETVCGRPSSYTGEPRALATGKQAVLALYDRLHEESVALIEALDDSRLQERCTTPAGASIPVGAWLRAMIEHEIHHRAQIYTLLGQRGVPTPPLFGLSAETVASRAGATPDDADS